MEFSLWHLIIILLVLVIPLCFFVIVPIVCYQHGKKVGDQEGYIRGLKEGQQSKA